MQPLVRLFIVSAVLCVLTVSGSAAEKGVAPLVVQEGMIVSLQYTLTGEDGKVIESNKGKAPLKYIHGKQEMIPGLERALTGMKIGAEKHVTVKPEDGYGLVAFDKFKEVPKNQIPPNGMKVGAELGVPDEQGRMRVFKVREIREDTVVLDMNHPMAGKTLVFDVKVVDIQPAGAAPPPTQPKPAVPPRPNNPAQSK